MSVFEQKPAGGIAPETDRADVAKRLGADAEAAVWYIGIGAILAFLYVPIGVLVAYSFNASRSLSWPMTGFTFDWYAKLAQNEQLIEATWNSLYVASFATALTLVIGVPAALALDQIDFPGKGVFRKLVLLPIALPGIITGISMLTMFRLFGFNLSLGTVIIGHATALLAVVVTQVYARLQRVPRSYAEASSDLGANGLQTLFLITLPNIRSAVIGAGLLSFTLSFDEIPVTFFLTGRDNTLPMYIWSTLRRGITPEINAVGALIVAASAILILISAVLLRDRSSAR
ncbi:ABC transporter permease [Chelativorans alearense]|uniref:ABC transporter permease n=1 Tax=Chelativorans alearense TaxID=2681495 RepID=UPI0013D7B424|nr:ABC transporter permease [Chelativorans alearense]